MSSTDMHIEKIKKKIDNIEPENLRLKCQTYDIFSLPFWVS